MSTQIASLGLLAWAVLAFFFWFIGLMFTFLLCSLGTLEGVDVSDLEAFVKTAPSIPEQAQALKVSDAATAGRVLASLTPAVRVQILTHEKPPPEGLENALACLTTEEFIATVENAAPDDANMLRLYRVAGGKRVRTSPSVFFFAFISSR